MGCGASGFVEWSVTDITWRGVFWAGDGREMGREVGGDKGRRRWGEVGKVETREIGREGERGGRRAAIIGVRIKVEWKVGR